MALLFESEPCNRCGGSGKHSYCQMYGDRCFKCGGRGEVLTKRGAVAQKYLIDLRSVRADQLRSGDKFWDQNPRKIREVVSVNLHDSSDERHQVAIKTKFCSIHTSASETYERCLPKNEDDKLKSEALEYQKTLTKAGKLRKEFA